MVAATTQLYPNTVPKKTTKKLVNPAEKIAEWQQKGSFLKWPYEVLNQLNIDYRWSDIVYDMRPAPITDKESLKAQAYSGHPNEDVRAGDRAPDAPGLVNADGAKTALFDLFKVTLHTILAFVPDNATAAATVEAVSLAARSCPPGTTQTVILSRQGDPGRLREGSAFLYHDKEGYAHHAYQVKEASVAVVIVRPDGYIGAFVEDAGGMQAYFSKVFRDN